MSFGTRTEATRDDWQTPIEIVNKLGKFDLDPAANIDEPTRCAERGFTEGGLERIWAGRVWLNPPYGRECRDWMRKLGQHGDGIGLIVPRMGANWFHEVVIEMCDAIYFLRGRVAYINPLTKKPVKGNNADSILVAYGDRNVAALNYCAMPGRLWPVSESARKKYTSATVP